IGSALDVIACEDTESAGVDRNGFMDAEFGREISNGPRPKDACVRGSPGAIGIQILLLAPKSVIDAAVQHEFAAAALDCRERHFGEQQNRIVIESAEANGIELAEDAGDLVVPAPAEIAGESPETFLGRHDETAECAGLTDDRRNFGSGFGEDANFFNLEYARVHGLDDEHALKHAAVDDRNAE